MNYTIHDMAINFICNIADDFLEGTYAFGKYRNTILLTTIVRRLDTMFKRISVL